MALPARRRMTPWPSAMIVWGPGFKTAAHRHHCVQLLMTLQGSLLVRSGHEKGWRKAGAVWVRPDATHEIDARGSTLLIGFFSAESDIGAALSELIDGDVGCVPASRVARWRTVLGPAPDEARVERWLIKCLPPWKAREGLHPGVKRVLGHLAEPRAVFDDLSLKRLADVAGLSPSRFMHAFTESVGVPVRPYILWLRLQRAACDLKDGASITSAAHRAGFSDAAHMTRTFRRMLGATPTDLALLTRISLGFAFESDQRPDGAARAIDGAA